MLRAQHNAPDQIVSVLTIGRGRADHLRNVILGLGKQTLPPWEMIIGYMQDAPYEDLPETTFPVYQIKVDGDALPLARARNAVAGRASGDVLAFLDIDCIPSPDFVSDYSTYAQRDAGLVMGEVMYLPDGAVSDDWSYADFDTVAQRHSDRQGPPTSGLAPCRDYRCFWSLNFAMHRMDWDAAGGFDPAYAGYGGEDTDFGRTLAERDIAISWAKGARVYHQHHAHCMPPIHHIPSILRNTEVFAAKWGHRTMEHWIGAFKMMGLVEEIDGELVIVRPPDDSDFELCRQQSHMPYANTARVLRILQARSAVAAQ